MPFIETIATSEAEGSVRELYDRAEEKLGYIPNYLKLFSHRPEVYKAWQDLGAAIRDNMTLRRYELVTLAAARKLGGTYCMLAHGHTMLKSGELDASQLVAVARNGPESSLTPEEIEVMRFAEKVVENASSITQADADRLKGFGITDAEILDITLAASARCFFSKTLDTLNSEPDSIYLNLGQELCDALSVGRAFNDSGASTGSV
jgi:uncharacterized peroxidase-related enzyme